MYETFQITIKKQSYSHDKYLYDALSCTVNASLQRPHNDQTTHKTNNNNIK